MKHEGCHHRCTNGKFHLVVKIPSSNGTIQEFGVNFTKKEAMQLCWELIKFLFKGR